MERTVYIPIEKKNREFLSKLLISSEILENGVTVVLGFYQAIFANAGFFPAGLMYFKGLNKIQYNFMKVVRVAGHKVVATDEEALGSSDPAYLMQDCWRNSHEVIDRILCQGVVHRNALQELRNFDSSQLAITGNSRIDLLRKPLRDAFDREAEQIRNRHGSFVLINSDCCSVNSKFCDLDHYKETLASIGWVDPNNPGDLILMHDHLEHDRHNHIAIVEFIRAMVRDYPERKIVLRPHPDEDINTWKRFAEDFENLEIITNTEAPPWIIAADCLFQTGCTTGVEAAVLGTPSISLICQPPSVKHPEFLLSHKVHPKFLNVDVAVAALKTLDAGKAPQLGARREEKTALLANYIDIDPEKFAYQKIGAEIVAMLPSAPASAIQGIDPKVKEALKARVTRFTIQDAVFDLNELSTRFADVQERLGRKTQVRIRDLDWGVFALEPA